MPDSIFHLVFILLSVVGRIQKAVCLHGRNCHIPMS